MIQPVAVFILVLSSVAFRASGSSALVCPAGAQLQVTKEPKRTIQTCTKIVSPCPRTDALEIIPGSLDSNDGCRIPHGPSRYVYSDGSEVLINYTEGKLNGKTQTKSASQTLISEENYVDGLKSGKQKHFFNNGKKRSEENYLAGVKHGEEKHWYDTGELQIQSQFNEGMPTGTRTVYYSNGNKMAEVTSGKLGWEGLYRDWYSNGHLHLAAQYKNGQLEGTYSLYFSNGKKWSERRYSKGIMDGEFDEWQENGNKICSSRYVEGNFQGWIQPPKESQETNTSDEARNLSSSVLAGDFDGNGYLDKVVPIEDSGRKNKILLQHQGKTIKEILIMEPFLEVYSARSREGQFGEPASPRDGLVVWGKGKETKVYLYDFNEGKFQVTTHMSDLDI